MLKLTPKNGVSAKTLRFEGALPSRPNLSEAGHLVVSITHGPTVVRAAISSNGDAANDAVVTLISGAVNKAACEVLFSAYSTHGDTANAAPDSAWKPRKVRAAEEVRRAAIGQSRAEGPAVSEALLEELKRDVRGLPNLITADTQCVAATDGSSRCVTTLTVSVMPAVRPSRVFENTVGLNVMDALSSAGWDMVTSHAATTEAPLPLVGRLADVTEPGVRFRETSEFLIFYHAPPPPPPAAVEAPAAVEEAAAALPDEVLSRIERSSMQRSLPCCLSVMPNRTSSKELGLSMDTKPRARVAEMKAALQRVEDGSYRVYQVDKHGRTPLHWVAYWAPDLVPKVSPTFLRTAMLFLLEAGSPLFLCDDRGETPVDIASRDPGAAAILAEFTATVEGTGRSDLALRMLCRRGVGDAAVTEVTKGGVEAAPRPHVSSLEDVIMDIPAPRCGQVQFSAVRADVIFLSSGRRLLMYDMTLQRFTPLRRLAKLEPATDVMESSLQLSVSRVGNVRPQGADADAMSDSSDEDDPSAGARFASACRFLVIPYRSALHGHTKRDVLLLSTGEVIGLDYTTPDPTVVTVATPARFDIVGGDGDGYAAVFHWVIPKASSSGGGIDRSTRVTQALLDQRVSGARTGPNDTLAPEESSSNLRGGAKIEKTPPLQPPSAVVVDVASGLVSGVPSLALRPSMESLGHHVALLQHENLAAHQTPDEGYHDDEEQAVVSESFGQGNSATIAVILLVCEGEAHAVPLTASDFRQLTILSSLQARVDALAQALTRRLTDVDDGFGHTVLATQSMGQRVATAAVSIPHVGPALALAEGDWLLYDVDRGVFVRIENVRPKVVYESERRRKEEQQASQDEFTKPLSHSDIATSAAVLRTPSGASVAVWAGKCLFADVLRDGNGSRPYPPLYTIDDGCTDSEATSVAVHEGFDDSAFYFVRRGEFCRTDLTNHTTLVLFGLTLSDSERRLRLRHGDHVNAVSGVQRIVFNCDASLLLRHSPLTQCCVVHSTRPIREKVDHIRRVGSAARVPPLVCGPGLTRAVTYSVPRERLSSFLAKLTSISGSRQQRIDHCYYVMAALMEQSTASGSFGVHSPDADGRLPLHVLAACMVHRDIPGDTAASHLEFLLQRHASVYEMSYHMTRPIDGLPSTDVGMRVLASHVERQVAELDKLPVNRNGALCLDGVSRTVVGHGGRLYFTRAGSLTVRMPRSDREYPIFSVRLGNRFLGYDIVPPLHAAGTVGRHSGTGLLDAIPDTLDVVLLHDGTLLVVRWSAAALGDESAPTVISRSLERAVASPLAADNADSPRALTPWVVTGSSLSNTVTSATVVGVVWTASKLHPADPSSSVATAGESSAVLERMGTSVLSERLSEMTGGERPGSGLIVVEARAFLASFADLATLSRHDDGDNDADGTAATVAAVIRICTDAFDSVVPPAKFSGTAVQSLCAHMDPKTGATVATVALIFVGLGTRIHAVCVTRTKVNELISTADNDDLARGLRSADLSAAFSAWCALTLSHHRSTESAGFRVDERVACRPWLLRPESEQGLCLVALCGPGLSIVTIAVPKLLKSSAARQEVRCRILTHIDPVLHPNSEMCPAVWIEGDKLWGPAHQRGTGLTLLSLREGHFIRIDPFQRSVDVLCAMPVSDNEHRRLVDHGDLRPTDTALVGGAQHLVWLNGSLLRQSTVHPVAVRYDNVSLEWPSLNCGPLIDVPGGLELLKPAESGDGFRTDHVTYRRPPRTALLRGSLSSVSYFFASADEQLHHLDAILNAIRCGRANPGQRDADGRTAFHILAAVMPHLARGAIDEWVSRLVDSGCNPHLTDDEGRSAFEMSEQLRVALHRVVHQRDRSSVPMVEGAGELELSIKPEGEMSSVGAPPAAAVVRRAEQCCQWGGNSSLQVMVVQSSPSLEHVAYALAQDGSVHMLHLAHNTLRKLIMPPRAAAVAMYVTAMRDAHTLQKMKVVGNRVAPSSVAEGARPVADLTFSLAQIHTDMILLSDGSATAARDPFGEDNAIEVLTTNESASYLSWCIVTRGATIGDAETLANATVTGIGVVWSDTVHTAPHKCVGYVIYAVANGTLGLRRLYPPPGITTIFPRHWPTMISQAQPYCVTVPRINAAIPWARCGSAEYGAASDDGVPDDIPPSVDTYGITPIGDVGIFVTCGRYSDAVLLFDEMLAPLQQWSLADVLPPIAMGSSGGYAKRPSSSIPVPEGCASPLPPKAWRRPRCCSWSPKSRALIIGTEEGLAICRLRWAAPPKDSSTAAMAEYQLQPILRTTASEYCPVQWNLVAQCAAPSEHPLQPYVFIAIGGRIHRYCHSDGRMVEVVGELFDDNTEVCGMAQGQRLSFSYRGTYLILHCPHTGRVAVYLATGLLGVAAGGHEIRQAGRSASPTSEKSASVLFSSSGAASSDIHASFAGGPVSIFLEGTDHRGVAAACNARRGWYLTRLRSPLVSQGRMDPIDIQIHEMVLDLLFAAVALRGDVTPNHPDADGRTALHYVCYTLGLHARVAPSALGSIQLDTDNHHGLMQLGFTFGSNRTLLLAALHRLLLVGASLYQADARGVTPFHLLTELLTLPTDSMNAEQRRHMQAVSSAVDDVLDEFRRSHVHLLTAQLRRLAVFPALSIPAEFSTSETHLPLGEASLCNCRGQNGVIEIVDFGESTSVVRWRSLRLPSDPITTAVADDTAPPRTWLPGDCIDLATVISDTHHRHSGEKHREQTVMRLMLSTNPDDLVLLLLHDGSFVDVGALLDESSNPTKERPPLGAGRRWERSKASSFLHDPSREVMLLAFVTPPSPLLLRLVVTVIPRSQGMSLGDLADLATSTVGTAADLSVRLGYCGDSAVEESEGIIEGVHVTRHGVLVAIALPAAECSGKPMRSQVQFHAFEWEAARLVAVRPPTVLYQVNRHIDATHWQATVSASVRRFTRDDAGTVVAFTDGCCLIVAVLADDDSTATPSTVVVPIPVDASIESITILQDPDSVVATVNASTGSPLALVVYLSTGSVLWCPWFASTNDVPIGAAVRLLSDGRVHLAEVTWPSSGGQDGPRRLYFDCRAERIHRAISEASRTHSGHCTNNWVV